MLLSSWTPAALSTLPNSSVVHMMCPGARRLCRQPSGRQCGMLDGNTPQPGERSPLEMCR